MKNTRYVVAAVGAMLILRLVLLPHVGLRTQSEMAAAAEGGGGKAGAEVLNFSLLDYHGRHFELRKANARWLVLFFTAPKCPVAMQNAAKLQALSEEFGSKGVAVWQINSMPQNDPDNRELDALFELGRVAPRKMMGDHYIVQGMRGLVADEVLGDRATIRDETREHLFGNPPIPPVLRDENQIVSRYFGVTRTGDTIVIDTRKMRIVYRGAVDDQFAEGSRKPRATKNFLREALASLIAEKAVETAETQSHGCAVSYTFGRASDKVSYVKEVAPVLLAKCVGCHSAGNIGPFAMSSYEKVRGWSEMIQEVLLDRRMPPWHADPHFGKFSNDRSLTAAEVNVLMRWIGQDCPRGEGDDPLAEAAKATREQKPSNDGWDLGKPDFVVTLPKQELPATGVLDYRYIDTDFEMPRDAWLSAAIVKPDNRRVIHHIIVRVRYPMMSSTGPGEAFLFSTWVPGLTPAEVPAGTGLFLPKGAKFNFEVHYTTNGTAQTDQSALGLYLAKETPPMRYETRGFETREIDVAPGEPDGRYTISYHFKKDTKIFALSPHMHLRGKWFKFELLQPDGKRETLLSVPAYDFNWQTSYRLSEPKVAPAGSWMVCTGGYDNSTANPGNPDATARVHWGPQSWNEMFMGFMDVAEIRTKGDLASPARGATTRSADGGKAVGGTDR